MSTECHVIPALVGVPKNYQVTVSVAHKRSDEKEKHYNSTFCCSSNFSSSSLEMSMTGRVLLNHAPLRFQICEDSKTINYMRECAHLHAQALKTCPVAQ